MTMKTSLEMKNRLHRYYINKPRLRHKNKYTKHKMCLSTMKVTCIKQHLSSIQEKVKDH